MPDPTTPNVIACRLPAEECCALDPEGENHTHQPPPTVFSLPAEPGPEVTELSDRDGDLWRPDDGWWFLDRDPEIRWVWHWLVVNFGPLSTTPPTGTETDHG